MSVETRTDETDESPHLTVRQLAKRWGTTRQAIYNMRNRGTAPPGFKRGIDLRFPIAEVEKWEAAALERDRTPSDEQRAPESKLQRSGRKAPKLRRPAA